MKIVNKIKRLLKQARGLFPSALPVGVAEFNAWTQDLLDTYTLPTSDVDSVRFAVASMIMHTDQTTAYKSNLYFVLSLKSAAAKQIAASRFQEIKQAQMTAAKEAAEKAKQAAEATAAAPNVSQVKP